jgi:hypothetical protein
LLIFSRQGRQVIIAYVVGPLEAVQGLASSSRYYTAIALALQPRLLLAPGLKSYGDRPRQQPPAWIMPART